MVDPGDDLESTVEHLRDRVDDLESQLDQESQSPATATRRDALKAGGAGALLGALGLGSITSGASADPQGRLGSASDPVQQAYISEADVTALSAVSGSVNGDEMVGFPGTSSSAGLSFGSWTTVDSNRPVWLLLSVIAQTDGSTDASVYIDIDESGGTTADYSQQARAEAGVGPGSVSILTATFPLPIGASVQVRNNNDPNGGNSIAIDRVFQL